MFNLLALIDLIKKIVLNRIGIFKPVMMVWHVTSRCNLSCPHCPNIWLFRKKTKYILGRRAYLGILKDLSTKKMKKIALEIAKVKPFYLQITGGEPLLRNDLENLLLILRPRVRYIALYTNATLLTEKRVKKLVKLCDEIVVSLNGFKTSDFFEEKINGIKLLIKHSKDSKCKIGVNTLVLPHNVKEIIPLFNFLHKIKIDFFIINFPVGWKLPPESECDELFKRLIILKRRFPIFFRCTSIYLKEAMNFLNNPSNYKNNLGFIPVISSDGDVGVSPVYLRKIGNILEEDLQQILARKERAEKLVRKCPYGHFVHTPTGIALLFQKSFSLKKVKDMIYLFLSYFSH